MPQKSKLKLPPIDMGKETVGQRLARLRKERGYTQVELAKKMGLIQTLISEYERDKMRLHAEMIVRFAHALDVPVEDILSYNNQKKQTKNTPKPSLKLLRRMQKIDQLPPSKQKALLNMLDTYLKGAEKN